MEIMYSLPFSTNQHCKSMIMWLTVRVIVLHDFLIQHRFQLGKPRCQLAFVEEVLNKRGGLADRLVFSGNCSRCWVMNSKGFDENKPSWFQSFYYCLSNLLAFIFSDMVEDCHGDNGVIKVGLELHCSHVGNFTVDIVQAL